jgi:hypothetical protein
MLSGKLIHLVEEHWNEIAAQVLAEIRRDPDLTHIHRLPDLELREWGQHILENLGHWLAQPNEEHLARYYERLGRQRFEEDVPLQEAFRGLCLLKDKLLAFIQDQAHIKTAVELYAEEELEHRVDRFFDVLEFHLIRGYENAWRHASAAHAVA